MAVDVTLKIDTVLGNQKRRDDEGALLLSSVQGMEGISMPYYYDVTLFHLPGPDGYIDPGDMIGTQATIYMRGETSEYTARRGVFQTFDKAGTNEQPFMKQTNYLVYKARIVPCWKFLDLQSRFQVFENMTMIEIIKEVLSGFNNVLGGHLNFGTYMSLSYLTHAESFPKIPYCVQFGETTLSFLHRLMSQYGIWYTFDHEMAREVMQLGNDVAPFKECARPAMNVTYKSPSLADISGFQRTCQPPHRRVWVSDFNMVNPTNVPRAKKEAIYPYDKLSGDIEFTPFYREVFPAPANDPLDADGMAEKAKDRIEDEEGNTFTVQGQTKNPTLLAGKLLRVVKDDTAEGGGGGWAATGTYLITQLSFAAYDNSLGHETADDIINFIGSPLRWAYGAFIKDDAVTKQGSELDPLGALSSAGLANWVQNQAITHSTRDPPASLPQNNPYQANLVDSFASGVMTGLVQSIIAGAVAAGKEISVRHSDDYSNTFLATPWAAFYNQIVSGPDATKPRAYGPHLAVVVGLEGTKDAAGGAKSDIYADKLGRVRIRFPWQRVVPRQHGTEQSPQPYDSDRRTAWVAVSESWAGHSFGTQFLPRIGQEVIVSFIDGDPERPIITGRRYNADKGRSNLPFLANQVDKDPYDIKDWVAPAPTTSYRFEGIKTASTPQASGAKSRYHLLRFDDTYNCEQVLWRSQGRLDITAYAHSFETVYGNKNLMTVQGTDKDGKKFGGNMFTTVGGEYDLHVGANRYEQIDKDYEITVKGNMRVDLKKGLTAVIKGDVSIAMNSLVIEATEKITLKVGSSFIVIDPCQVHLNGANVYKTASGSAGKAASVTMQDIADAIRAEPGDEWNKRVTDCNPHGAGGGGRGTHTENPTPGPSCAALHDGSAIACQFIPEDSTI